MDSFISVWICIYFWSVGGPQSFSHGPAALFQNNENLWTYDLLWRTFSVPKRFSMVKLYDWVLPIVKANHIVWADRSEARLDVSQLESVESNLVSTHCGQITQGTLLFMWNRSSMLTFSKCVDSLLPPKRISWPNHHRTVEVAVCWRPLRLCMLPQMIRWNCFLFSAVMFKLTENNGSQ